MKLAAVATAAGIAYALGWLTRQPEVAAARREASIDALTGLVNRHGLKRQLQIRTERHQPYTIYFLDLNGFKAVNDAYGHRAGDQLLACFGRRLASQLAGHLVARLGGDEFVVVAAGRPDHHIVALLQATATAPTSIRASPDPVILSAAIGVAYAPAGADPRSMLHTADMVMYRSKRTGEPCYAGAMIGRRVEESPRVRIRDARSVRVAETL